MNTSKLLIALLLTSSSVFADIKPYIEGQLIYINPDDVDGSYSESASLSGLTLTGNLKGELEYDSEVDGGFEIGFKLQDNHRFGFSYSQPDFEFKKMDLTASISLTDGITTITESASGEVTRAELASLGVENLLDNEVKLYMLNYYYDFNAQESFRPFIGAGLGLADIDNAKDKEITYGIYAGAKYYFVENAYLGAKYTFSTINGPTDKNNIQYDDIDSHAGSLLIGFEF